MNASSETWQLGNQSVQVTHLEKVYWPQVGFTKGDVLHFYRQIAPVALPYLKDRPVTLHVYPQGVEGASYYLRDCPEEAPDWLRRVDYQSDAAFGNHLLITARIHLTEPMSGQRAKQRAWDGADHPTGERANNCARRRTGRALTFSV